MAGGQFGGQRRRHTLHRLTDRWGYKYELVTENDSATRASPHHGFIVCECVHDCVDVDCWLEGFSGWKDKGFGGCNSHVRRTRRTMARSLFN